MINQQTSRHSTQRLPYAALMAVVLIVGVEAFLHTNRLRLSDGVEANFLQKMEMLRNAKAPADDYAVFGDSKMFSVRPDALAHALSTAEEKLQVSNYSWPFFGVEAYEAVLSVYLRYRSPPQAIIINGRPELVGLPHHRNSLAADPAHRRRAFIGLPWGEIAGLALRQQKPALLWHRLVFALQPPSSLYPEASGEALKDLLRGRGWPDPGTDYVRMTRAFKDTGSFLMHQRRTVTEQEVIALEQVEGPYRIYRNHAEAESFERFLVMAGKSGIDIYLIGSPAPPPYRKRFERAGILEVYRQVLSAWEEKYPHLQVIEPLYPVQPLEHFGDAGHLNQRGDDHFQMVYPEWIVDHIEK